VSKSQIWKKVLFFDNRVARCSQFGKNYQGLRLENVDIFYVWPFGIFGIFYDHSGCTFCDHLVHFFQFWYHAPRKIWQPCLTPLLFFSAGHVCAKVGVNFEKERNKKAFVNQEKKNICEQLWLSAVKPTLIRVLGQR
jgi:hypothetical protein